MLCPDRVVSVACVCAFALPLSVRGGKGSRPVVVAPIALKWGKISTIHQVPQQLSKTGTTAIDTTPRAVWTRRDSPVPRIVIKQGISC